MGKGSGGPCFCDGKEHESMDNFLPRPMVIDGVTWMSAEQYFQAAKFEDEAHRERIRCARDGQEQWELGQSREHRLREDWEEQKVNVMYEANKAKFEQHEDLRQDLVSSQGEISPVGFPFWIQWNRIILERLREELRPEGQRDEAVLKDRRERMEQYCAEQRRSRLSRGAAPAALS
eukprot:TRINITY_DN61064_c0_g1_i1.p1 TRINITY_DN61064_c0_g1~~TRINITY_DN61064_c0_g1_i1.p1  ORF type:complete len:176 (+),score=39.19 TRINITY_DN61064_c0_g1_i1:78-605(+)